MDTTKNFWTKLSINVNQINDKENQIILNILLSLTSMVQQRELTEFLRNMISNLAASLLILSKKS